MKFKFFCMFGSIAFLTSCNNNNDSGVVSQRFVHKYGFDVSESEWTQRNKDGQVVTTFKNGITKTASYKNGLLHGATTLSFPNTSIIQEKCEYNEGTLIKKTNFELSGLPVEESVFEPIGKKIITVWDKNGVPLSMEEYNNNLLTSARYYNSQNEIEATVSEGFGTRIKRDRSNLLLSKEKVENGQVATRTTYHPNGVVHTKRSFIDYKLNGTQETFSPSGNLLSRATWKMGKLDGVQTTYRNGKPYTEITYVDGKKHGIEKEYDNFGLVAKEINWANDQRHGTSRITTKNISDMEWFWRGISVERKKFQMLKFREELISQLNGEKPMIKPQAVSDEQIVLEDEMTIKPEEEISSGPQIRELKESNEISSDEGLKSLADIKAEIQVLKAKQKEIKTAAMQNASKKVNVAKSSKAKEVKVAKTAKAEKPNAPEEALATKKPAKNEAKPQESKKKEIANEKSLPNTPNKEQKKNPVAVSKETEVKIAPKAESAKEIAIQTEPKPLIQGQVVTQETSIKETEVKPAPKIESVKEMVNVKPEEKSQSSETK